MLIFYIKINFKFKYVECIWQPTIHLCIEKVLIMFSNIHLLLFQI